MNRILFAVALLLAATSASAVDVTLTFTAGQANRFAAVCGERLNLVDEQTPPQSRSCTMAEAKAWLISILRATVQDAENAKAKAAVTTAAAFDPQ